MIDIFDIIVTAYKAGKAIIEVYESADNQVEYKNDKSPLTFADQKSHEVITESLQGLYSEIPILSEEGRDILYDERKRWESFWLIDPLDGTKEYIKRNGEFTVNISLIKQNVPVLGVIYVPVKRILYFAQKNKGAYKLSDIQILEECSGMDDIFARSIRLPLDVIKQRYTIVGSRSHLSRETEIYIKQMENNYGDIEVISSGSSLKFCLIAEGKADVYPRFAPTMEWDIAAGHIIAEESGAVVTEKDMKTVIKYNKESLLNPWFVVQRIR